MNLGVLGYGAFGKALCYLLHNNFDSVFVWNFVDIDDKSSFKGNYKLFSSVDEVLEHSDYIIISTSSLGVESVSNDIKNSSHKHNKKYVLTSKGINTSSLKTMSQIFSEINPDLDYCVFSGPTFAKEIMKDMPVWALVSSKNLSIASDVVDAFKVSGKLALTTSNDPIGTELFAAMKNVAAIVSGIVDYFKFGDSAKGAILALVLREIFEIAKAAGADCNTILTVAGLGDFITTCCGQHSRNYKVGMLLGEGKSIDDILIMIGEVSEGVKTTESVYFLSNKYNLYSRIISGLYDLIYNDLPIKKFVNTVLLP